MEPLPLPSDEEIRMAYAQGEEQVLVLFQRAVAQLAARVQALEDLTQPASLPDMEAKTAALIGAGPLEIRQGDIFWVLLEEPGGPETSHPHPQVVIQENVFNRSRIQTVLVCAITSNRKRASLPGNVALEVGEANLPRPSVVEVSKISTVAKTQLGEYIGSLSQERIEQILAGLRFLQSLTEPRD